MDDEEQLRHGLDRLIWPEGTLEDCLRGFAEDITRAFSELTARNLVQAIFNRGQINGHPSRFTDDEHDA